MVADQPVEHVDVLIVGAGLSGIAASYYLERECPWASYAVLEARDAIGGTWDLFRFPGIRSDSDMFTLGYAFRPWAGEKSIVDGNSILQYLKDTAAGTGIDQHIRFHHRVVRADWSTEEARWHITAERTDTHQMVQLTCDFVLSCSGYYRYDHGHLPDFAGMDRFEGTVVHPQSWPEHLDYRGKRVVVIGSGATAVTLVPALAATAAHVTMLQRSPSYVVSLSPRDPIADLLRRTLPVSASGPILRWYKAITTQATYQLSQRWPTLVKRLLRSQAERQLPVGYDVSTHFTPTYNPWDQRLCVAPNGDLFAAIKGGSASVVTDHIDRFTPSGLRLRSGAELEADIIVTATGLELLFLGGIELSLGGEAVDVAGKLTYKGMMLEGVPNLAFVAGYTNASWTLKCELTCDYVCRLLNRMRTTGMRQCTPHNHDASVSPRPLLGLTSGYVRRAADRLPKQGSKPPWQVHQSYLRDYRAIKRCSIEDDAMSFSNPVPAPEPAVAS